MQKLDRKGKILFSVGISLIIIGVILLISGIVSGGSFSNTFAVFLYIIVPIAAGTVLLILQNIKQKRKQDSNFKKEENNASLQIKNPTDDISLPKNKSEKNRKCKVCGTNISVNEKSCPGCGDIYS
ncbi:MAG: hypothetical protein OEL81_04345 [Nitrosopumilus sp.]|nr:hypothetical protein [Nitrosopumilus sp.]